MGFAKCAMAILAIWQPDIPSSATDLKIRSQWKFLDAFASARTGSYS
jgi:hypothetical protein